MLRPQKQRLGDPSSGELLEFMQVQFSKVDERFDLLTEGVENLKERLEDVQHRVVNLEHGMADAQESLDGVLRAIDKDAATVIDHERRITRLEKTKV